MALVQELEAELRAGIKQAAKAAEWEVNCWPEEIKLETPPEEEHGEYATNLAMVLAGQLQRNPHKIAEKLVSNLQPPQFVDQVEIAGPGFINFHLNDEWLYDVIEEIRHQGTEYGRENFGQGTKVQVEFVSANPTGPLHIGHGRGAVVGDVLANILTAAGFEVEKEYYINDAGNQMDLLGKSVAIRYQQLLGEEVKLPSNAYHGDYIEEIAAKIIEQDGKEHLSAAQRGEIDYFREFAYESLLNRIKDDLHNFRLDFDNWFSERSLHSEGIQQAVEYLQKQDLIYEAEEALWFKSTEFGDDKDRVVIKNNGQPTYLAADIAYHWNKFNRGFDEVINVWGADHHGYVERMKAVVEALGYGRKALTIILVQMVTLLRGGEEVSMSKRAGNFITLEDIVKEVGVDAARYFYIMRSFDSHLDFDLELAKQESTDNPVYYIQYAHARICSILDQMKEEEVELKQLEAVNLTKLKAEPELNLMHKLADYPQEIIDCAQSKEPHHLARFAYDLAALFHKFYNKCKVLIEDQELMQARLQLLLACKQVLVNVLDLLGISAPESM